jgi:hypothetical protein
MQPRFADDHSPQGSYAVCCGAVIPQEGLTPVPCACCASLLCGRSTAASISGAPAKMKCKLSSKTSGTGWSKSVVQ